MISSEEERQSQEPGERRRQYESELEPLVAEAAPKVRDGERAWLGRIEELLPGRAEEHEGIPEEDRLWYEALEAVVHRRGLSYELITDESGGAIWLVPQH